MVIAGFAIPSPGLSTAGPEVGYGQARYHALARPAAPTLLLVPSIKLKAPVIPIDIVKGAGGSRILNPPEDVREVGWWRGSARAGAVDGQTVITGHTVHTGGGVMNELGNLRPGAVIQVKTRRGTVEYRATKIFVYTKDELSKHATDLFGQDRHHNRLVLVTCTGWTGSEYTSNIIVLAEPLGVLNAGEAPTPEPGSRPHTPTKKPAKLPDGVQPAA